MEQVQGLGVKRVPMPKMGNAGADTQGLGVRRVDRRAPEGQSSVRAVTGVVGGWSPGVHSEWWWSAAPASPAPGREQARWKSRTGSSPLSEKREQHSLWEGSVSKAPGDAASPGRGA